MSANQSIEQYPYDPTWPTRFQEARATLAPVFGEDAVIEHIGSTAVAGLSAKPVIDVLVMQPEMNAGAEVTCALEDLGYASLCSVPPVYAVFVHDQEPKVQLHVAPIGSDYAADRLLFRDYLRGHPERCEQHRALKAQLAETHGEDTKAYTDGN